MDISQVIFEKIFAYKGHVLLRDLVNFLRALDDTIDDNVKVNNINNINNVNNVNNVNKVSNVNKLKMTLFA